MSKSAKSVAPATTAQPATAQAAQAVTLQFGKPYNVRPNTQNNNAQLWQAIASAVQANGGTIAYPALWALCNQHNNGAFARYATARGWLVAVKAS